MAANATNNKGQINYWMQIKSIAIAEENIDIVKTEFDLIKCDLRQKRKEKEGKKNKRKEATAAI